MNTSIDAKTLIRQYEKLKSTKPTAIIEKVALEREWLQLYKDMTYHVKKMTKKQKEQLKPFVNKAREELKKNSVDVFRIVTEKGVTNFSQLLSKHEAVYFKTGVKGLMDILFKQENLMMTADMCIAEAQKKEGIENLTIEQWMNKVRELISRSYINLEEAYKVEQQSMELFEWWTSKTSNMKKNGDLAIVYNQLCNHRVELANYMLKELGYTFEINKYIRDKEYKEILRTRGLLMTIQALEEKSDFVSPMVEEILEKITFLHPREEFKHVRAIKRHFVIHSGATNSGKTYRAIEKLKQAKSGLYLAPIRLLALETQEKLLALGVPCNLMTGENEVKMPHAQHQSSTIEMAGLHQEVDVAVIDEMQMIEDAKRGNAWLRAIFGLRAKEVHLCGSPHAVSFIIGLIKECGDTYEVHEYERQTELVFEEEEFVYPESIRKGDALIAFSKGKVISVANELREEGYKVSMIYGKLPPDARKKQVEMFLSGQTDVIVATDSIGIGLNLPIQRVVFLQTKKFDGKVERPLSVQEVKQIAGRAGRKGKYEIGFVNALSDKEDVKSKLTQTEEVIKKSVIAPSKNIMKLEIGTLRQRLIAWKEAYLDVEYLDKADIQVQLNLLKHIEKWEHELDIELLFKTLYVPFEANTKEVLFLWIEYVRELKEGRAALTKPKFLGNSPNYLEIYYHQLNLYYNFSRKFKMYADNAWVQQEKTRITETINRVMKQKNYKKAI